MCQEWRNASTFHPVIFPCGCLKSLTGSDGLSSVGVHGFGASPPPTTLRLALPRPPGHDIAVKQAKQLQLASILGYRAGQIELEKHATHWCYSGAMSPAAMGLWEGLKLAHGKTLICYTDGKGVVRTKGETEYGEHRLRGVTLPRTMNQIQWVNGRAVPRGIVGLATLKEFVPLHEATRNALWNLVRGDELAAGRSLASRPKDVFSDLTTRLNKGIIFGPLAVREAFVQMHPRLRAPLANMDAFVAASKYLEELMLGPLYEKAWGHGYRINVRMAAPENLTKTIRDSPLPEHPFSYLEEILRFPPMKTLNEELHYRAVLLRLFQRAAKQAATRIVDRVDDHQRHFAFWMKFGFTILSAGIGAVPVPGVGGVAALLGPVVDYAIDKHSTKHPASALFGQIDAGIEFILSRAKSGEQVPGLENMDKFDQFTVDPVAKILVEERQAHGEKFSAYFESLKGLVG